MCQAKTNNLWAGITYKEEESYLLSLFGDRELPRVETTQKCIIFTLNEFNFYTPEASKQTTKIGNHTLSKPILEPTFFGKN